eukprot:360262-Chlamydomonas_euryale.AAC.11
MLLTRRCPAGDDVQGHGRSHSSRSKEGPPPEFFTGYGEANRYSIREIIGKVSVCARVRPSRSVAVRV